MCTSIVENSHNLDTYQIMEISSDLHIAHMVPGDEDKFVFYINNDIDWD